jgi:hypothetical protein
VQVTAVSSGPGPGFPTRCTTPVENQTACTASRGPHGETVVAVTWHGDRQGTPAAIWYDVTITKPDGTLVTLHSGGAGPAHPTPSVTIAQLIKIGVDPRLTLG